ncbi:MAG TPA: EAL domain-containing protein [Pyrinomonadaceae bacterium]|nr:EAL domain-containing protein [Pyrinomonadaceae bacterium]
MSTDATLTIWQRLTDPYRKIIVAAGAATLVLCAYELPIERLDLGFILLCLITVAVSSRVSVPIPRINATVTVSDTFIFLTLLLYGTEAAVVLAALEGVCAGSRVSRRLLTILCNSGALVCATYFAGTLAAYAFGRVTDFEYHQTSTFISFVCLLALAQYAAHTGIGAAYLALKSSQPLFRTWTKHYLWSSVTYFVGALLAGAIAKLSESISFYSLIFPLPVIAIVYLSYRKYLEDVRSTAAKAEQAERDRAEAERERAEAEHERAEQAERHVEELNHYIAKLESAQSELSESKEHFRHAAYHDTLTGLPNRLLFTDHLRLAIERTRRDANYAFAVLFLDADRFKNINDSLGHTYGDQLLTEIAERLRSCTRQLDTVARFGGDEFALLLDGIGEPEDAVRVAQKIQEELLVPFDLNGHEAFTSVSIGIALSGVGYNHPEDLLRDADTAMYRAKDSGKARHEVFDRAMHTRAVKMLRLENDLRRALERQEFRVHYQPILTLKTGELAGFEALVRWERPDRGMVSPMDFIPLAEETGMIVPLGLWVLEEACAQLREWQMASPANRALTMSVNLSGKQLAHTDVAEQVQDVLSRTNLDARHLKLEITESVVMENAESAAGVLARLRSLGVGLSIDDFGTGYSSLSYLHRFPVNTLKVDRSFVSRMTSGDENLEIVRTIVTLARNLGMDVVAEGIETGEQLAQLKALKCEYGQGYFFAKPLDAAGAGELLLARDLNSSELKAAPDHPATAVTTLGSPLVM